MKNPLRHLVVILGDQLDRKSSALDGFDPAMDRIWMAEAEQEATYVWSHKLRIAFFFSAMRHFRDNLLQKALPLSYHELQPDASSEAGKSLSEILEQDLKQYRPKALVMVRPGDYRVFAQLCALAKKFSTELIVRPDRHFFISVKDFHQYARNKKKLLLENFYRQARRQHHVLMTADHKPVGGQWNFDRDNRRSFGNKGPGPVPETPSFAPDAITSTVIHLVESRFGKHPGELRHFDLPVTASDAEAFLAQFIDRKLSRFGEFQDAMWTGEPFLFHSRISAAMNIKLLDPRTAVANAVEAVNAPGAPLNSVEGFVRQILGWREYIRGIYWLHMPGYLDLNHFGAGLPVPRFFWDGKTDMACVRDAMSSVIRFAYSHHIQRLMVFGLFCLLGGVDPRAFHQWHMAMYADAVDWVSLPNTLGMSQYADGGIVGSKPYCASGAYINRMSNYCAGCRFEPSKSLGETACPFTTLYWDFLSRNLELLKSNPRMRIQLKNLDQKSPGELNSIRRKSDEFRKDFFV